jgi:hypothetical protein
MPNQYSNSRSNRLKAIEEGKKTYIGSTACKHCGSCEKYVSSYNCAPCSIKKGLEKLNNEELMKPYRTKEKQERKTQEWREKNPSKLKSQYLRHSITRNGYNITEDEYYQKLNEQNGVCAICNMECEKGRLSIDHDHIDGNVRGLLCRNCNLGLGNFKDRVDFLENAMLYLKSYKLKI